MIVQVMNISSHLVCVCYFHSSHMPAVKGEPSVLNIRWSYCSSGLSLSLLISVLYMRHKWKKLNFIQLSVYVSSCLIVYSHFAQSDYCFTCCFSRSCPVQQLLLHLHPIQKPIPCPSHPAWETVLHRHAHTHTLPKKCVRAHWWSDQQQSKCIL